MDQFNLESEYQPAGDQPQAIAKLVKGVKDNLDHQVLLGATGTGKTFTIANVIAQTNRHAIVLSHNKTLAAQLYAELKGFFPNNRVVYFISNFDYYRPEAYMPASDTFIDKTSKSNWDIEAMRMEADNAMVSGKPVIVVASVAAIYGQMNPQEYQKTFMELKVGDKIKRADLFIDLVARQYKRNNLELKPGTFRARGDVYEIAPATTDTYFFRIETFDDEIEAIKQINFLTGEVEKDFQKWTVYPATEFSISRDIIDKALKTIALELEERLKELNSQGKLLEAQRLEERTKNDLDSLREFGVVGGMENYSRHFDLRQAGERPFTVFDYLLFGNQTTQTRPLMIIDESHMMIPQLNAMYNGDRARKENLVNYGFRLPSALDNRPLRFQEWEGLQAFQRIYVSATPSDYELAQTQGEVVQQIVRPTGLLDPLVEVRSTINQIEQIYDAIKLNNQAKARTFILTTNKRMAEELARYLQARGIKAYYLHSDHKTFERDEILRKLRLGVYDVVIGVNLIREGIDIPEISQIHVLDADKESFFRSTKSLIQIIGRAARNVNGKVFLYGDKITQSMQAAMSETARRRKIQAAYNAQNKIVPQTIVKAIPEPLNPEQKSALNELLDARLSGAKYAPKAHKKQITQEIAKVRGRMLKAAREMDFERAAQLRDLILELEAMIA